jgi:hypothetical protein
MSKNVFSDIFGSKLADLLSKNKYCLNVICCRAKSEKNKNVPTSKFDRFLGRAGKIREIEKCPK